MKFIYYIDYGSDMRKYLGKKDLLLIANPLGIIMQGIGAVVLIPLIIALIYNEANYLEFVLLGAFFYWIGINIKKIAF